VGMSRHVYAAVKKCVLSLLRKVDKELVLLIPTAVHNYVIHLDTH